MQLAHRVYTYYTQNFMQLTDAKRFHFASRLAAWNDDTFAQSYLEKMRPNFAGTPDDIREQLKILLTQPSTVKRHAAATRQPYFDQYPTLQGRILALFRVRHLLAIYSIDARPLLLEMVDKTSLYELSDLLQQDKEALKVLSTYAVNYIYLVEAILFPRETKKLPLTTFLEIGETYSLNSSEQIQLYIYLYTHCIIGASNFYQHAIPADEAPVYNRMLASIESVIATHYDEVSLDNKLEFLVCCQITHTTTGLKEQIYTECNTSLSTEGDFVVDSEDTLVTPRITSFGGSEHRNVLLVMSTSAYKGQTEL